MNRLLHRPHRDEAALLAPATKHAPPAAHLAGLRRTDDAPVTFRDLPAENPHLLKARPAGPAGRVNVQRLGLRRVPLTTPVDVEPRRHSAPTATPEENAAAIRTALADIRAQLAKAGAR